LQNDAVFLLNTLREKKFGLWRFQHSILLFVRK
jgi:hypothetical protein